MKISEIDWKQSVLPIICLLTLVYWFVFTYVFYIGVIPTSSMEPTLIPGSVIICRRTQNVKRGDIVVFRKEGIDYIKRVIGIPGEIFEITPEGIFIDGSVLEEPYVVYQAKNEHNHGVIPKNQLILLGDNRQNSIDFRTTKSFVKKEEICGVLAFSFMK